MPGGRGPERWHIACQHSCHFACIAAAAICTSARTAGASSQHQRGSSWSSRWPRPAGHTRAVRGALGHWARGCAPASLCSGQHTDEAALQQPWHSRGRTWCCARECHWCQQQCCGSCTWRCVRLQGRGTARCELRTACCAAAAAAHGSTYGAARRRWRSRTICKGSTTATRLPQQHHAEHHVPSCHPKSWHSVRPLPCTQMQDQNRHAAGRPPAAA